MIYCEIYVTMMWRISAIKDIPLKRRKFAQAEGIEKSHSQFLLPIVNVEFWGQQLRRVSNSMEGAEITFAEEAELAEEKILKKNHNSLRFSSTL